MKMSADLSRQAMKHKLKARSVIRTFFAVLLIGGVTAAKSVAQEASEDALGKLILDMFQGNLGSTLCPLSSTTTNSVRRDIANHLRATTSPITGRLVAETMWALYPCPFSPARPELRLAVRTDIEGAWLFPENSQKLRFGPRSIQQAPTGPLPVKCETVAFYPGGERRNVISAGPSKCPFSKAADLDVARSLPQVATWHFLRDGRIGVTRTDVVNHVEEWELYLVTEPFTFGGVQFAPGNLVAYQRRVNGNDFGVATQFMHLQRLP